MANTFESSSPTSEQPSSSSSTSSAEVPTAVQIYGVADQNSSVGHHLRPVDSYSSAVSEPTQTSAGCRHDIENYKKAKQPSAVIMTAYSCGRRNDMEDTFSVEKQLYLDPGNRHIDQHDSARYQQNFVNYFGVFDGHGGPRCAKYAKDNLFKVICRMPNLFGSLHDNLKSAFLEVDHEFLLQSESIGMQDGTTAVIGLLNRGCLHIAHVGDSRAVLASKSNQTHTKDNLGDGRQHQEKNSSGGAFPFVFTCQRKVQKDVGGKTSQNGAVLNALSRKTIYHASRLTQDHKPNRRDEERRIQSVGGMVIDTGCPRVFSDGITKRLAVSRALGNYDVKRQNSMLVIAEPECVSIPLSRYDKFVVFASDGIWDVLDDDEVVQIVASELENGVPLEVLPRSRQGFSIRHECRSFKNTSLDTLGERGVFTRTPSWEVELSKRLQVASERVIHRAYEENSQDNMTCLVAYFDWGE